MKEVLSQHDMVLKSHSTNPDRSLYRWFLQRSAMAKHHGVDPYSMEGLLHRHENRQLLLQRLSTVRQQIKDLEREAGIFQEQFGAEPGSVIQNHAKSSEFAE